MFLKLKKQIDEDRELEKSDKKHHAIVKRITLNQAKQSNFTEMSIIKIAQNEAI